MPGNLNAKLSGQAHSASASATMKILHELKIRVVTMHAETRIAAVPAAVRKQVDKEFKMFEELFLSKS